MAFETRDMSGVLFKNDKKGNEKAPDYTGTALISGNEIKVSAWVKEGKKGKFLSLSFKEPFKKQDIQNPNYSENRSFGDSPQFDDEMEVPF